MKNAPAWARPGSSRDRNVEAGQGTLEYLLVLVVVVLIILGVLYQFNSAFKNYVAGYFGDYVSCLLEVGDLPGVASDCTVPNFSLNDGKKLITSGGGGGGGSSSSSSSSSSPKSSSASTSTSGGKSGSGKSSSSSSSGSSSASGSGSESAAPGGSGRVLGGNAGRQKSTAVGTVSDAGNARGTQDDVLGISPTSTSVGHYSGTDRSRLNNMSWGYYDAAEEKERAIEKPVVTATTTSGVQNTKLKSKSAKVEATRTIASQESSDSGDFSFGGMIRLLLIILMIVAIVVFFGGQILQISKSGE